MEAEIKYGRRTFCPIEQSHVVWRSCVRGLLLRSVGRKIQGAAGLYYHGETGREETYYCYIVEDHRRRGQNEGGEHSFHIRVKYCLIRQGLAKQQQLLLAYMYRESRVHGWKSKVGFKITRVALHHGSEIRKVGAKQHRLLEALDRFLPTLAVPAPFTDGIVQGPSSSVIVTGLAFGSLKSEWK